MIILISPAKGFNDDIEIKADSIPALIDKSEKIIDKLKNFSQEDIKKAMKVNDKIAKLNFERFANFKFDKEGAPALLAYNGIQYKNIGLDSFTEDNFNFAQKHIRILSALYGVLKTNDSIYPYRLDFLSKISVENTKNLYDFWASDIYDNLSKESDDIIINLASEEYSKAIRKYLNNEKYISCVFKVDKNSKLKVESTASKMARGKMLAYIVKNKIQDPELLKNFSEDNYVFREDLSSANEFIFVCKK